MDKTDGIIDISDDKITNKQVYFIVAQIDERTKALKDVQTEIKKNLDEKIVNLSEELRAGYVKNETFDPVKKIVYGLVSLILGAVAVAFIGLVLKR